jgi:hypothetical protein
MYTLGTAIITALIRFLSLVQLASLVTIAYMVGWVLWMRGLVYRGSNSKSVSKILPLLSSATSYSSKEEPKVEKRIAAISSSLRRQV